MAVVTRAVSRLWAPIESKLPTRVQTFFNHPAGPKTIFFWAPTFKWGLVIAGLADLNRPVERVSLNQNIALAATGIIWSRYSVVIIPKNYNLLGVNLFVAWTGLYQLYRIYNWRQSQKVVTEEKEKVTKPIASPTVVSESPVVLAKNEEIEDKNAN